MEEFSLLRKLQKVDADGPTQKTIEYQKYTIVVDGKDETVSIPIKECVKFEQTMEEYEELSRDELRKLMREFRGLLQK